MSANPLVAGPVDTTTPFGGTGVVESITSLSSSLSSGNWLAAGLSGVGTALDVAATVVDPLGSLIGAGLGWIIDHLEPLKGWLDDLTGDAGAVLGFAGTWDNVAAEMSSASVELSRVVHADLEGMKGSSIQAYTAYAEALATRIGATHSSSTAIAASLRRCAEVVRAVHDLVRDTLSQLAGSIVSWAAEETFSLGLATPWVVGQVSTRVASLAGKIGRSVTEVVESAKALKALIEPLGEELAALARSVRGHLPGGGAARDAGAATHVHAPAGGPRLDDPGERGVAFFGPDGLSHYADASSTLGPKGGTYFHMPLDDAAKLRTPQDVYRETGAAGSVRREIERHDRPEDAKIFGLSFPTHGLETRAPTLDDAGGYEHYLPGGHTAIRQEDDLGGIGVYAVNKTHEQVVVGGPRIPDGSVLFELMKDGSWAPMRRFP